MRLMRLSLRNFRQHADTQIEFGRGLTGVIGPNGAGKSTLLEAIAWAIYGAAAARGTNETLRFSRAPERSPVRVELVFGLGGHRYRVTRTLTTAAVYLNGGEAPVATSVTGVSRYLERRLSMTREEFFNTYFTGQKELQFLAQMGSAERGRFLSRVLGYERLREAQELTRSHRNGLRHEAEGLRAGLPDPDALKAELEQAERRRERAADALGDAEAELEQAQRARAELEPRWTATREARDAARELEHELDVARRERETAERDASRAGAALDRIAGAETELDALREELKPLPGLVEETERLAEGARLHERRGAVEESERALAAELEAEAPRLEKLERAPGLVERYEGEVEELERELAEAERELESRRTKWVRRTQEVETRLETYRSRAEELKQQARTLRASGPEGVCPTCERPLGDEAGRVLERLEDEWQTLVQDGKWLRQRLEQLGAEPEEVRDGKAERARLRTAVDDAARRLARCEQAVVELREMRRERRRKEKRLETLRDELGGLPTDYDAERHRRTSERLERLRELERRASRLEQTAEAREAREAEREEARRRADAASEAVEALERRSSELEFSEETFAELRAEHEGLAERVRAAELRATELRGELGAAEEALEMVARAQAAYEEKAARLDELEMALRHHNELDGAFSQLRAELNARVRPELSELASLFLTEITEGRYTALDIDEDYNIMVLDEGEQKPVISGGEEDIANLVLRLAVSQMIAERAGHPLSVLILDEVFGSLDLERRDNVVELLHRIGDRFDQVILITHVESIREGLDNVIGVEYDERSGASVVREDSLPGGTAAA